jgi:hypothetical protein
MGVALAIALAAFVFAHLWLVGALASRRAWLRAVGALLVPPLAPWWGWQIGQKTTALAWLAALGVYAGLTFAAQSLVT